jgi:membrane dipeptidase
MTVATEGESWDQVLENIDTAHSKISRNNNLVLVEKAQDIREAKKNRKLAIILGTQGSEVVDKHLTRIRILQKLGVRYIGLAYTGATLLADGCGETRDAGLTFLGRDFIEAVNELPVLLDLSHTGHRSRLEAAALAKHPVCTHSNAYAVNPNDRNTKDETARIIAEKGGVMGVTGLDHADHWVTTIGSDHTGIGLDLTEGFQDAHRAGRATMKPPKWRQLRPDIFGTTEEFYTQKYPRGLETIRQLPNLTHGLLVRGYSADQIQLIMGESWLRNLESVIG